jgi:hypothetical protein
LAIQNIANSDLERKYGFTCEVSGLWPGRGGGICDAANVFEGIEKLALEYEISNPRKPSPNGCELSGCLQNHL